MIMLLLLCLPVAALAEVKQIIVPVTLTYQGRTATISMAVDTGASVTTIDTSVATQLGIVPDGGGFAQMADGRSVRYRSALMDVAASTMLRAGIQVNIMDYSAIRNVKGMLGLNFLAGMTMTINWEQKRIYWSE